MPRNRIIYNIEELFVGPSKPTGTHLLLENTHILQRVERVKAFSWRVDAERTQIIELGNRSVAAEPILTNPRVQFDFDYCLKSIENEARIGLNVNYTTGNGPLYPNNSRVSIISGFADKNRLLDNRNFYLFLNNSPSDLSVTYTRSTGDPLVTSGSGILSLLSDPAASGFQVMAFVNSYLNSYKFSASVGDFPHASLSYVADTACVLSSGNGFTLPMLDTATASLIGNSVAVYPSKALTDTMPSVLLPGDINLSITTGSALPIDLNDFKINSFEINLDIPRKDILALGHKSALDRPIVFPVFATVSFDGIVGDLGVSSFTSLFNQDAPYSILATIRNPRTGVATELSTAFRIDVLGAKYNGFSSADNIGSNKNANISFKVEINPDSFTSGLFVSGIAFGDVFNSLLEVEQSGGYYLTAENGDIIITEDIHYRPTSF